MTSDENKLEILRKVEQGVLSIEEGAHLLEILDGSRPEPQTAAAVPAIIEDGETVTPPAAREPLEVPAGWRTVWSAFLWLGIIFMGLTGYWLFTSYTRSGMGWGFWLALIFLGLSCGIVYAGWQLLISRWMVVRIRESENEGEKAWSFWAPLPLQWASWVFRTFGQYMPDHVQQKHIETILQEMEQTLGKDEPFQVEIDGEHGSRAHINVEFS